MKKALKLIAVTLSSIVGLVLIVAVVAIWVVFTPAKLTPIVRDQLPKFVTCETTLDEVDLTFFSTFPHFGLHIQNVCLTNPIEGSASDTLAYIGDCTVTIDLMAFLKNNDVVLNQFYLENGFAHIYTNSKGETNYDIMVPSEEPEDSLDTEFSFGKIDLQSVTIKNLRLVYADDQSNLYGNVDAMNADMNAALFDNNGDAQFTLNLAGVTFDMNDSTRMSTQISTVYMDFNGIKEGDDIAGNLLVKLPDFSFKMDDVDYAKSLDLLIDGPVSANLKTLKCALNETKISLNDQELSLDGWAQYAENGDIPMDLKFASVTLDLKKVLNLLPKEYADMLSDLTAESSVDASGSVVGVYNDSLMPQIKALMNFNRGTFAYKGVPYTLKSVKGSAAVLIDMNPKAKSSIKIIDLSAKTGTSLLRASGNIADLMGDFACDFNIKGDLNLPEMAWFLPEDMKVLMKGRAKGYMNTQFKLDDFLAVDMHKIKATGTFDVSNLDIAYEDSMLIKSPSASLSFTLPCTHQNRSFTELLGLTINSSDLKVDMIETMKADLSGAALQVGVSDFMDTTKMMSMTCDFDVEHLFATMDTMTVDVVQPKGTITLSPSRRNPKNPRLLLNYNSQSLVAKMGNSFKMDTKFVKVSAATTYNDQEENLYLRWSPRLDVDFNNGVIRTSALPSTIIIPTIKFNFNPRQLTIEDSRIIIDQSDFRLSGIAKNFRNYAKGEGLLEGEFDFVSEQTHVTQLMDLMNGFGVSDSTTTADVAANQANSEQVGDPFIVPKGINITLNTKIKKALYAHNKVENVNGKLTIKDGVIILEQIGFTSEAAEMQLTALYRSDRPNNLFAGVDFHLLNIDIKKLIDMIPDVDTIFPMLKSFDGRAQFHFAGETYMKGNYDFKMSTLRGATAIEGKDLVLLDSETFGKIAKPLLFSRKTKNLVDSISVEATVFRNEVDIYPFIMSMDNYSAIIAARYDLNNNYNAHVETVSPIRLALQITGNATDLDNMSFKLQKTKYSNLFKPEKRNATQERTLALKKLISDALKENVK